MPCSHCADWWWWCNGVGDVFLAHFRPIGHRLNATAYLSIVCVHVHPFMATMSPSSDGYFQQENTPCHKAPIFSNWFLEHVNKKKKHPHHLPCSREKKIVRRAFRSKVMTTACQVFFIICKYC